MSAERVALLDLEVVVSRDASTALCVAGDIDIATAPLLRTALAQAQAGHGLDLRGAPLVVDLSAMTFIDASGLRVLARAAERARRGGGQVVLRRPSPMMVRLLRVTGLLGSFEIDCEAGDAVARLHPAGVTAAQDLP
jgi:anti-sigma B factor antagonist